MSAKRAFDFIAAFFCLILFFPILIAIAFLIYVTSRGPSIYWAHRIGRCGQPFLMPKFRTMDLKTPQCATHLLEDPDKYITPLGKFLRSYSLDELPQFWSILIGDMSFVGPRPALFNQGDLIELRERYGINRITPGLTGWAQVNGRDELSIPSKVMYDLEYLNRQSFLFDLKILWQTFLKVFNRAGVSH